MKTIDAVLARRTTKDFTGQPVTREDLETLLELSTFAPNHHLTEPWRFFVVSHERIAAFSDVVVNAIGDEEHPKLLAKREGLKKRLPKLGAFVALGRVPLPDDPMTDREDFAACCCAAYAILLAATDMGLGSHWHTGHLYHRPQVRAFLGVPDSMEIVASIWLGVPADAPHKTSRTPACELTHWA